MSALLPLVPAAACGLMGWIVLRIARDAANDIALMDETSTSPVAAVADLAPGAIVELAGVIRCDAPLRSPVADEPAAWFRVAVASEDGAGRGALLEETVGHASCRLEDATGSVAIDFTHARVEGGRMVRLVEPPPGSEGRGLRHEETVLRPDRPVFVLGIVREDGSVGASARVDRRFVIASQCAAERAIEARSDARLLALAGRAIAAAAVLGAGLAGWSALSA